MNKFKIRLSLVELLLILFSFLISLYGAEAILRVLYVLPHPIANYYPLEAAKLGKTIHIRQYEFESQHHYNSEGFRDKEFNSAKQKHVQRVLFVGDSFTEGYGVQEGERFSNKLIEKLGAGFEEINVGQLATNPDTYLDNIASFGIAFQPDIIVMGVFLGNDFMGGRDLPSPLGRKVNLQLPTKVASDALEFISLKYVRSLWQQVRNGKPYLIRRQAVDDRNFWDIYYNQKISKEFHAANLNLSTQQLDEATKGFNQNILQQIYGGRLNTGMFGEAVHNQLKIKEKMPYYVNQDYENEYAYIREANKIAKEHSIRFLVLIIPDINQVHPSEYAKVFKEDFLIDNLPSRFHQLEEFRDRLNIDLEKDNISFVDATKALRNSGKLTYYLYDNHMNKLGHEIVAELLCRQATLTFTPIK